MPDVRNVTVKLNADVAKYISDIRRSGKETESAFAAANTAAARLDDGLSDVTDANQRVAQSNRRTADSTNDVAQANDRAAASGRRTAAATRDVGDANEQASRSTRRSRDETRRAGFSYVELGARLATISDEGEEARDALEDVGETAGLVGAAAAAGLGLAVVTAASFESQISAVKAATNDTSLSVKENAEALGSLRDAAVKAGADTVFSANDAAQAETELAKAGVSTADILAGALTGSLDLASAGQLEVANAAEIAATTLNQFGLEGDQASHVADVLAAAAGKAQGEVTDMAGALQYVGPVAAQMGVSLEETAGSIALLASQGIVGEKAGTSLRGILTGLTSPSKLAAKTMAELGIQVYDTQGQFVGFAGIAGQLQGALAGLDSATRDQALGQIFGNEQITAARILYSGGAAAVDEWTASVDDSGFAADQAATKLDNLGGDWEALTGSFETALIGTGEGAQGPLRNAVQQATDLVNGYAALPGPAHVATAAVLGLTAAIGGGLFVYAKWQVAMASAQRSMIGLGVSANRAATATKLMSRSMAATAGIALLGVGLTSTNKKMSALASAAGGAALGFSVGGPWGAAIGGAAGLVLSLARETKGTSDAVKGLSAAFDAQTGALSANAKQIAANQLLEAGGFAVAQELGLSRERLTEAVLGNAEAQKEFNAALAASDDTGLKMFAEDTQALIGNFAEAGVKAKAVAEAAGEASTATDDAGKSALSTAAATGQLSFATGDATQSAQEFEEAQKNAAEALKKSRDAARSTAQQFFGVGDAVDDADVSLDGWITDLEKQADALLNFRRNAVQAADRGLRQGLIAALEEAGPAGAMRMKQLADGTDAQIKRANAAWKKGQEQVGRYVDLVGGVPTSVTTKVNVEASAAMAQLYSIQRLKLNDKTIFIHTQRVGDGGADFVSGTGRSTPRTPKKKAAGGYIRGPGSTTSDSIPAWLSDKEYVVKAAAVQHYGVGFFDTANAMAFADGGLAGRRAAKTRTAGQKATRSLGGFDVDLSYSADDASSALDSFKDELNDVRSAFKDAKRDIPKAIETQLQGIRQQSAAYDALTATLVTTRSSQAALVGAASGSFNGDLFGKGLAGLTGTLNADTNDSTAMQAALAKAIENGLDGGLFEALAGSGDLVTGQEIAGLDAAGIQALEDKFAARSAAQSSLGRFAGDSAYSAEVAKQTAAVTAMKASIDRLEKQLPGAVRDGAKEGSHSGSKSGTESGRGHNTAGNGANSKTGRRGGRT